MSIFVINTPKAVPVASKVGAIPLAATPDAAPDVAKPGEQPGEMDANLSMAQQLEQEESESTKPKKDTKGEKIIILDGPVSRIYSAALQQVFANEGMAAMYHDNSQLEYGLGVGGEPVSGKIPDESEDDGLIRHGAAGVEHTKLYSYTEDTINVSDVVRISNEVTRFKGRNFIVAIEGITSGRRNTSAELLAEMEKAGLIKLCFSRETAVSAILSVVKS